MSTPRASAPVAGLENGHLSDANLTPREEDSEAYKASSGPGSKHSSLSSHDTALVQQSLRGDARSQASSLFLDHLIWQAVLFFQKQVEALFPANTSQPTAT